MEKRTGVIFLHGSGDTGPNLRVYLDSLPMEAFDYKTFTQVSEEKNISVFTPSARYMNYSPAFGTSMSVWFDRSPEFTTLGIADKFEDTEGIRESLEIILSKIHEIEKDFDFLIIGGFSMGGGLCLHLLRETLPAKVVGIFTMSSFLIESSSVFQGPKFPSTCPPLMMMHGINDTLIQHSWGQATGTSLMMAGADLQFRQYEDLDHELCPEELADLMFWMIDLIQTNSVGSGRPLYADRCNEVARDLQEKIGRPETLPYTIEKKDEKGSYRIKYPCPTELIDVLTAKQVLARGSCFDIVASSDGKGVQTIASTTDPEGTAEEIGKRLLIRVQSGGAHFNPCPMS